MPYFCPDMRPLVVLVVGLYGLYAQQCASCGVSGLPTLPQGFDPSSITLTVGQDTEVVIQFTFLDVAQQSGFTVYPNYAVYVDSLRMAGGDNYVVVKGTTSTPVSYANGAFTFDQAPRYKQVRIGAPPARVVVYRNPSPSEAGVSSGQPSPPRGCVRACIKGRQTTPEGGDSLYILLRAFVPQLAIGNDVNNKDTSNLMPTLGTLALYSDTSLYYGPIVVSQGTAIGSALQGGIVLSPNPAWGVAMVRFTTTYSVPVRVRALDASGRVVHERDMGVLFPGEHTADLQLPAGLYIVELLAGKESYKARLVVLE